MMTTSVARADATVSKMIASAAQPVATKRALRRHSAETSTGNIAADSDELIVRGRKDMGIAGSFICNPFLGKRGLCVVKGSDANSGYGIHPKFRWRDTITVLNFGKRIHTEGLEANSSWTHRKGGRGGQLPVRYQRWKGTASAVPKCANKKFGFSPGYRG